MVGKIKEAFAWIWVVIYGCFAVVSVPLCSVIQNVPTAFYATSKEWEKRQRGSFLFAVSAISLSLYLIYYAFDEAAYWLASIIYKCGFLTTNGAIFIAGFSIIFTLTFVSAIAYKSFCDKDKDSNELGSE